MTSEELLKKLNLQFTQSLPFVVYRKPNTEEVIAIFQSTAELYTTKQFNETGFVFAPFDSNGTVILIPFEHSEMVSAIADKVKMSSNEVESIAHQTDKAKAFHINLVQEGIQTIKNGDLRKVVLSRIEIVKLSEVNPIEIFKRLSSNYPAAFVYCFYHPKVGLWLGATPETLLKIEGHQFFTTALAGTQKYKGKIDVVWNQKEKDEQNIVTNYIVDNLKPIVQSIKVETVKTVKAGSLLHLKSNISGTIDFRNLDIKQMLNTLHPTPAVCGFPKEKAKQFILKHENYHREFYTGFLGELNFKIRKNRNSNRRNVENNAYIAITNCSNLFVNLRCMQLNPNEAKIYVGGGVTIDSNPEAEWEETVNKTQTIKSVL